MQIGRCITNITKKKSSTRISKKSQNTTQLCKTVRNVCCLQQIRFDVSIGLLSSAQDGDWGYSETLVVIHQTIQCHKANNDLQNSRKNQRTVFPGIFICKNHSSSSSSRFINITRNIAAFWGRALKRAQNSNVRHAKAIQRHVGLLIEVNTLQVKRWLQW
jgi:hypothetical protein